MKKRTKVIVALLAVVILALWAFPTILYNVNTRDTIKNTDEEIEAFIEAYQGAEVTAIVKTGEKENLKIVLHEREDLGLCIATFERKASGRRLAYLGTDTLEEGKLFSNRAPVREGRSGLEYTLAVVGDNRNGRIGSYVIKSQPHVTRDHLESDFIIDFYTIEGEESIASYDMLQYAPDGTLVHPS